MSSDQNHSNQDIEFGNGCFTEEMLLIAEHIKQHTAV